MSRGRLAAGAVGLVAVAALILLLLLSGGGDSYEPSDADLAALEAAPCPPRYEVLRSGRPDRRETDAARAGRFVINGETVRLQAPVDWTMNPQQARAFSHQLFKFQWIDPLLYAYRKNGDRAALEQATGLTLDFARANPPEGDPVDPDVWDDKRSGDRGPYLAYILRAAQCEGLLDGEGRTQLMALLNRHAATLTNEDTYKPTNHGLFVDLGLTLLARQLDFLPDAAGWGDLGRSRFEQTLRGRTYPDEGMWLEHSAGYQLLITRTLTRFLEIPGNSSPSLVDLRRKMQDVVGWLEEPDGKIPQFGDSDLKQVPSFGVLRARDDRGILDLHDSGLAVVKQPGSYLSVLASYHSDSHKHADDLTFDLYEHGHRIISDTGLYHKDKDENFAFAHATRAHSVLTVDGEEFPRDGTNTYGSGILETGKGHGFDAILGTNPLVGLQGVDHKRLLLYEPGKVLVIVDRVEAAEPHRYARFLQFGPDIRISKRDGGLALRAAGFHGAVRTNHVGGERIELARGEHDPLRGLTSPSFRRWVPRWTARLRTKGTNLDHVTTMTLAGAPMTAKLVSFADDQIRIDLSAPGEKTQRLEISDDGGEYRIRFVHGPDPVG